MYIYTFLLFGRMCPLHVVKLLRLRAHTHMVCGHGELTKKALRGNAMRSYTWRYALVWMFPPPRPF